MSACEIRRGDVGGGATVQPHTHFPLSFHAGHGPRRGVRWRRQAGVRPPNAPLPPGGLSSARSTAGPWWPAAHRHPLDSQGRHRQVARATALPLASQHLPSTHGRATGTLLSVPSGVGKEEASRGWWGNMGHEKNEIHETKVPEGAAPGCSLACPPSGVKEDTQTPPRAGSARGHTKRKPHCPRAGAGGVATWLELVTPGPLTSV